jgi:hypothetical protein
MDVFVSNAFLTMGMAPMLAWEHHQRAPVRMLQPNIHPPAFLCPRNDRCAVLQGHLHTRDLSMHCPHWLCSRELSRDASNPMVFAVSAHRTRCMP